MIRSALLTGTLLVLLVAPARAVDQSTLQPAKTQTRPIAPQPGKVLPGKAQPQNRRVVVIHSVAAGDRARVAQLPARSEQQLRQLLAAPGVVVLPPRTAAASLDRNRTLLGKLRQQFATSFQASPAILKAIPTGAARLYANPLASIRVAKGARRPVVLLGADALVRDALVTQRLVADARHQALVYEVAYKRVAESAAKSPQAMTKLQSLPAPAALKRASVQQINGRLAELLGIWRGVAGPPGGGGLAAPGATACAQEIGYGFGGDQQDGGGSGFNPDGLHERYSWPLKAFNTCVKNQGARGACTAFAVTGAVESLIALQYGRRVNLSEQDLYKHARLDWGPVPPDFYGDGHFAELSLLAQLASWYVFPEERSWDYNPSFSRRENDTTRTYADSCLGYQGEACSDTNHQAAQQCYSVETTVARNVVREVCEWVEVDIPETGNGIIDFLAGTAENAANAVSRWVCTTAEEVVEVVESTEVCVYQTEIPGTSGYRVRSFQSTGYLPVDRASQDLGLLLAKLHLDNREPVALSFFVPTSFHNADSTGFVRYDPADVVDGGHCVLVTGYVDNGYLPAGVPPGAGGGYLIIKNSWGKDWGDMGYGYLPYDWVRAYAVTMTAVTAVSRS
jgi:hypothetical protein